MGRNVWVKPKFNKSEIDRAGQILASDDADAIDKERAFHIMNNWRMSHSLPLNSLQLMLRRKAAKVSPESLVAQRLKRAKSIVDKLKRFQKMKLARMQDLGGCRAIMPNISDVYSLKESYENSRSEHRLKNTKDYIESPQETGYRGVHLILEFNSKTHIEYNGMLIEIQLRTRLQHAWATAVEVAGTFTNQALKSNMGEPDWRRFFALISSAFAIKEGTNLVPNTPQNEQELYKEIKLLAERLDVINTLSGYKHLIKNITDNEDFRRDIQQYFLLRLTPGLGMLEILPFDNNDLGSVSKIYLDYEREAEAKGASVALVSVASVDSLQAAYPNYFLDADVFLNELKQIIQKVED